MTLDAMHKVVAQLLTSRSFQAAFFAAPASTAAQFGLDEEELRALQRIDPRKLGISSEGYAGKRFERVESAYPLAYRTLMNVFPAWRGEYLALTNFPPDEDAERATFLGYLRERDAWPEPLRRLARDLAELDEALQRLPALGVAQYRMRPDLLRPRHGPGLLRHRTRGPLATVLDGAPAKGVVPAYADDPHDWLVVRNGPTPELVAWREVEPILKLCDGARSLPEIESSFPAARPLVEKWLRTHVLADAGTPSPPSYGMRPFSPSRYSGTNDPGR